MKNRNNNFDKIRYLLAGFLASILFLGSFTLAGVAEPGSQDDPLVTLNYVENRITELSQNMILLMNEKINDISGGFSKDSSTSDKFKVLNLKEGEIILLHDSTEFILRSGDGYAIVSENGGLADLTMGNDIGKSEKIPKNHHILVPRNDGRGVSFSSEAFVMVKGNYTIKKN